MTGFYFIFTYTNIINITYPPTQNQMAALPVYVGASVLENCRMGVIYVVIYERSTEDRTYNY